MSDLRPEIRMRELKAEHERTPIAEDLDRAAADMKISVNIRSALEWRPED